MPHEIPNLSAGQSAAWSALVSVCDLLPAALDDQLSRDGGLISFEYGILCALDRVSEDTMRMGELARALHSPAPRLSKACTRLVGRGLIERMSCQSDRRSVEVRLTDAGRQALKQAAPAHAALARDTVLGAFNEDELVFLSHLLDRIVDRLTPDDGCAPPAVAKP